MFLKIYLSFYSIFCPFSVNSKAAQATHFIVKKKKGWGFVLAPQFVSHQGKMTVLYKNGELKA